MCKLVDYKNENMQVIVSGIGVKNMYESTLEIAQDLKMDDRLVNIGICGASKKFNIGDLLEIDLASKSCNESILTCVDKEVSAENIYDIVDMESDGFIQVAKSINNSYIFKIVSDHFEPKTVTKDKAKKLIFNKIDEIMEKINK